MEKQTGNDPECMRMMVFIADHFPNASRIRLVDENHFLSNRNIILEKDTKRFYEVKCFERRGIHFFGQRVLNNGNLYTITEINPFFVFLPYLWADLMAAETAGSNLHMKPLADIVNEDRNRQNYPMLPVPDELKAAFHENAKLIDTLKKSTVNKEIEGLYFKLTTPKLYEFLTAKLGQLTEFVKKNGFLIENSLRKIEFMQKDIDAYALEIIQEMVPRQIFLGFLEKIGKKEEEVFKHDEHKAQLLRDSTPDYSEGPSKPMQKVKVTAPAPGNSKIQKAGVAAGQTSVFSYFTKK